MKITRSQLRRLIRETLNRTLLEDHNDVQVPEVLAAVQPPSSSTQSFDDFLKGQTPAVKKEFLAADAELEASDQFDKKVDREAALMAIVSGGLLGSLGGLGYGLSQDDISDPGKGAGPVRQPGGEFAGGPGSGVETHWKTKRTVLGPDGSPGPTGSPTPGRDAAAGAAVGALTGFLVQQALKRRRERKG